MTGLHAAGGGGTGVWLQDIIGAAETGSGKTLAFGLPILHHILREGGGAGTSAAATGVAENGADEDEEGVERDDSDDDHRLRALIIAPTRELALQVRQCPTAST